MISLSHLSGLFLGVLLGFVMQRGRFCCLLYTSDAADDSVLV